MNVRFKDAVTIYNGKDYKHIESDTGFPVMGSGGQFAYASDYLYDGEVILLGRKGTIDRPLYYVGKCWSVDTMYYAVPKMGFCGKYLYYCSLNFPFLKFSTATALPSMTKSVLERFHIPDLTLCEQEAIAAYLDRECEKIGRQIELLERKADAYKRLRRSIINRAVTRGLNPHAPLKPSGIPFLGEVPQHWVIRRIKSLFDERVELSETGQEDLLSVSEYYGVAKRADKVDGENISRSDSLEGYKLCYVDDIVSNIMLAWKGSLGRTSYNGIVSPAYGVYKPIDKLDSMYYHFLFRTEVYKGIFRTNSRGIIDSRLRLYTPNFLAIHTVYPPVEEQKEIVAYLDEKCGKIDAIIENIDTQVERLKELKRSLINEVVTGKRAITPASHD